MCGIVGYIEKNKLRRSYWMVSKSWNTAAMILREWQCMTERRSISKKRPDVCKVLNELTHGGELLPGTVGIGHTRWATHGEPSMSMRTRILTRIIRSRWYTTGSLRTI